MKDLRTREVQGADSRCPYCHGTLDSSEDIRDCEVCGACHHSECWASHGRCASCNFLHAKQETAGPNWPTLDLHLKRLIGTSRWTQWHALDRLGSFRQEGEAAKDELLRLRSLCQDDVVLAKYDETIARVQGLTPRPTRADKAARRAAFSAEERGLESTLNFFVGGLGLVILIALLGFIAVVLIAMY